MSTTLRTSEIVAGYTLIAVLVSTIFYTLDPMHAIGTALSCCLVCVDFLVSSVLFYPIVISVCAERHFVRLGLTLACQRIFLFFFLLSSFISELLCPVLMGLFGDRHIGYSDFMDLSLVKLCFQILTPIMSALITCRYFSNKRVTVSTQSFLCILCMTYIITAFTLTELNKTFSNLSPFNFGFT